MYDKLFDECIKHSERVMGKAAGEHAPLGAVYVDGARVYVEMAKAAALMRLAVAVEELEQTLERKP